MGVCGRASASGRVSHRVALDATAEEGDDDGCEGSDGIGKAVRRITGLPLSFESMVSNWKWRPNRLSYKDMVGAGETVNEEDEAEDEVWSDGT